MPALAQALKDYPDQVAAAAIKLLLYTGLRSAELLRLKWDDIDFDAGEFRLLPGTTKSGRSLNAHLAGPALAVLASLPRELGNPYVFPGMYVEAV